MKKNKVILTIITLLIMGIILFIRQDNIFNQSHHENISHDKYYCPMHPQILYDHPGRCPICGMDLVKKVLIAHELTSELKGYTTINVSSQKQEMIGLQTESVGLKQMVKTIRTVGTIASDVQLYQIQNEFIDAYLSYANVHRDYKRINDRSNPWGIHRDMQVSLLEAREKLLKLGLSEKEIAKLQDVSWNQIAKQPKLVLFNDNRSYWVMAQVFEQDYSLVKEGQIVEVSIPACHEQIKGIIRSVGGFIDPTSRSVTALIELVDGDQQLAANMLVDITIPVKFGNVIFVPREAVMDTGLRKIVFICKSQDSFEPREIKTGLETDEGFEVKSGLKAGERIVISGNFLLDSESRVQASLEQGGSNE